MAAHGQRISVSLPEELVNEIDRSAPDRDSFVAEAVKHELTRRQKDGLQASLEYPHAKTLLVAEAPLCEWPEGVPADEWSDVLDEDSGEEIRWVEGKGWQR